MSLFDTRLSGYEHNANCEEVGEIEVGACGVFMRDYSHFICHNLLGLPRSCDCKASSLFEIGFPRVLRFKTLFTYY